MALFFCLFLERNDLLCVIFKVSQWVRIAPAAKIAVVT